MPDIVFLCKIDGAVLCNLGCVPHSLDVFRYPLHPNWEPPRDEFLPPNTVRNSTKNVFQLLSGCRRHHNEQVVLPSITVLHFATFVLTKLFTITNCLCSHHYGLFHNKSTMGLKNVVGNLTVSARFPSKATRGTFVKIKIAKSSCWWIPMDSMIGTDNHWSLSDMCEHRTARDTEQMLGLRPLRVRIPPSSMSSHSWIRSIFVKNLPTKLTKWVKSLYSKTSTVVLTAKQNRANFQMTLSIV